MKRLLILLLILLPLFTLPVSAADTSGLMDSQAEKSGASDLGGSVPSSAKSGLGSLGVTGATPSGMSGFSVQKVFSFLWQKAGDAASAPFKAVAAVFGILLLCALMESMKTAFAAESMKTVFGVVCTLAIAGVLVTPILQCITTAAATVKDSATFLTAFLPVFAGLSAASGHPASAVLSQGAVLAMAQVLSQIASTTFVPMVSLYLAFCVIGSVSPGVSISSLAVFARKAVSIGLVLLLTIFTAVLTVQGFIAQSADTVSMKTAKFVVSSAVPVVGSAISDAMNTVVSCAGLLKSAVGAYAIVVFLAAYLPALLECAVWMLAVDLALALADITGGSPASALLKGVSEALKMLTALVTASALAMIVSICILLIAGGQTA